MKLRLFSLLLALALLCALLPAAVLTAGAVDPEISSGVTVCPENAIEKLPEPIPDPNPPASGGKGPTRAPSDWAYESNVLIAINQVVVDALRAGETTVDISGNGIHKDAVNLYSLNYYSPYITSKTELSCYYNVETNLYTKIKIDCTMSQIEIDSYFAKVNERVAEIDAVLAAAPDAVLKALVLHDYLAYHCEYDYDRLLAGSIPENDDSYKSAGVVMHRIGVCQSYSYAFMYFMHRAKIECHTVASDSMNHMWNLLKLGGDYYHVDVTWDDPTPDNLGLVRHNFFLVSDSAILASRGGVKHYGWSTPSVSCANTVADNAFWYTLGIKSPIVYGDGFLYFSSGSGLVQRNWESTAQTVLAELGSWPKTASSVTVNDSYTGLYLEGKNLFYNTASQIRCINLDTRADVSVLIPGASGSIFGTAVTDGVMYYVMKPYVAGTGSEYSIPFAHLIPACAHAVTAAQHKDATCTEPGYDRTVCSNCGAVLSETTAAALGHAWDEGAITEPATETAEGVKTFTCTRCGAKKTETIPMLAHTHSYTAVVTAPTCTAQGYTTHTCACGDSYVDAFTEALGHAWNDGVITVPATETAEGVKTYTCTRCGAEKTETIPKLAHTHSYTAVVTAPTCTAQGYTTHTCACGDSYVDSYTAALGHDWLEGAVIPPTETEDGRASSVCTRCGAEKITAIPATGEGACKHEFTHLEQTAPTCLDAGYDRWICNACGALASVESVPALGHALEIDEAVAATCTASGLTEGSHCTRCAYNVAQETIPALGHDYKNGVCTRCGAKDPNAQPVSFVDVSKSAWYYDAVNYAVSYGLMNGVGNSRFAPDDPMTRAMLVTVLWRYEGSPLEGFNSFNDVPAGQWYTDAVAWASYHGIVGGIGGGKFDPNGNITREQMAAILYRYANGKGFDTSARGNLGGFPDRTKVSAYADDAISWTVGEGIIGGSDGKLLPQGNATRAQVSAILMRFIENVAKK